MKDLSAASHRFLCIVLLVALVLTLSSCLKAPELLAIPDQSVGVGVQLTLDIGSYAVDPHNSGNPLQFYLTDGLGNVERETGIYRFTATDSGVYSVEISVVSGYLEDSARFKITVN
jgi:hypothetical protein